MQLPVNAFKHAIEAGKLQIGFWSILSSHVTVEILAGAGFDWLVLDTEHAPNELPMVYAQLQACKGGTAHPVVRVPWNDMVSIKRFLDMGMQSLLIPYIETEDQARSAVDRLGCGYCACGTIGSVAGRVPARAASSGCARGITPTVRAHNPSRKPPPGGEDDQHWPAGSGDAWPNPAGETHKRTTNSVADASVTTAETRHSATPSHRDCWL